MPASPVYKERDGVGLALHGDVVVVVWNAAARVERMVWVLEECRAFFPTLDGRTAVILQLILEGASPPDRQTFQEGGRRMREMRGRVRRFITVSLGTGLWSALVRTVMSTIAVAVNRAGHFELHNSLDDALAALARVAGPFTPSTAALSRTVDAVLQRLGAKR